MAVEVKTSTAEPTTTAFTTSSKPLRSEKSILINRFFDVVQIVLLLKILVQIAFTSSLHVF